MFIKINSQEKTGSLFFTPSSGNFFGKTGGGIPHLFEKRLEKFQPQLQCHCAHSGIVNEQSLDGEIVETLLMRGKNKDTFQCFVDGEHVSLDETRKYLMGETVDMLKEYQWKK